MSDGVGTPSRDFTRDVLFSSRMMSMQSSTHSSQMKTVGPAMSLRTSCWLLPQNEQYRVFFESLPLLLITYFPPAAPIISDPDNLAVSGHKSAYRPSMPNACRIPLRARHPRQFQHARRPRIKNSLTA